MIFVLDATAFYTLRQLFLLFRWPGMPFLAGLPLLRSKTTISKPLVWRNTSSRLRGGVLVKIAVEFLQLIWQVAASHFF